MQCVAGPASVEAECTKISGDCDTIKPKITAEDNNTVAGDPSGAVHNSIDVGSELRGANQLLQQLPADKPRAHSDLDTPQVPFYAMTLVMVLLWLCSLQYPNLAVLSLTPTLPPVLDCAIL